MDTKLTLKLDISIIEQAKKYAEKSGQSLSFLVENFFRSITSKDNLHEFEVTPLVKKLSGIVKNKESKKIKIDYTNYLINKYK